MMKLFDFELSGNCYKVRLFAALAGIPLELQAVDLAGGEHRRPPLSELNPWSELPVLVDGDLVLRDSQAILVYLANSARLEDWWPSDPASQGQVSQWLSTAAGEIQRGPASARLVDKFGYGLDKKEALKQAERILDLIESHLSRAHWLALGRPTIAECAVFPYVAWAPEGGIDLTPFPRIRSWIDRVKELPGFLSAPGI